MSAFQIALERALDLQSALDCAAGDSDDPEVFVEDVGHIEDLIAKLVGCGCEIKNRFVKEDGDEDGGYKRLFNILAEGTKK